MRWGAVKGKQLCLADGHSPKAQLSAGCWMAMRCLQSLRVNCRVFYIHLIVAWPTKQISSLTPRMCHIYSACIWWIGIYLFVVGYMMVVVVCGCAMGLQAFPTYCPKKFFLISIQSRYNMVRSFFGEAELCVTTRLLRVKNPQILRPIGRIFNLGASCNKQRARSAGGSHNSVYPG